MTAREAIESGDFDAFIAAFADDAVWIGAGENAPAFSGRDAIAEEMRSQMRAGLQIDPELVLDTGDAIVVDMHPDPAPPHAPRLHNVFRIRGDRIVRVEDHPDRKSALGAVGSG